MNCRRRKPAPHSRVVIDETTLDRFRGAGLCEGCGRQCQNREAAHVMGKGFGGWSRIDHPWNLVALGGPFDCACHAKSHNGQKPTTLDLIDAVAAREGVTAGAVRDFLNGLKWGRD